MAKGRTVQFLGVKPIHTPRTVLDEAHHHPKGIRELKPTIGSSCSAL